MAVPGRPSPNNKSFPFQFPAPSAL